MVTDGHYFVCVGDRAGGRLGQAAQQLAVDGGDAGGSEVGGGASAAALASPLPRLRRLPAAAAAEGNDGQHRRGPDDAEETQVAGHLEGEPTPAATTGVARHGLQRYDNAIMENVKAGFFGHYFN